MILNEAFPDDAFKRLAVTFIEEDLVAGIATIEGMIDLPGETGAKSTGHGTIPKEGEQGHT